MKQSNTSVVCSAIRKIAKREKLVVRKIWINKYAKCRVVKFYGDGWSGAALDDLWEELLKTVDDCTMYEKSAPALYRKHEQISMLIRVPLTY